MGNPDSILYEVKAPFSEKEVSSFAVETVFNILVKSIDSEITKEMKNVYKKFEILKGSENTYIWKDFLIEFESKLRERNINLKEVITDEIRRSLFCCMAVFPSVK